MCKGPEAGPCCCSGAANKEEEQGREVLEWEWSL